MPPDEEIAYLSIDVARCHKQSNVLTKMDDIAMNAIKKHGGFQVFLLLALFTMFEQGILLLSKDMMLVTWKSRLCEMGVQREFTSLL